MAVDTATIVQRLVPGALYGSAKGATANDEYTALAASWRDGRALPTLTAVNNARSACDADQTLIDNDPKLEEMVAALLATQSAVPAIAALLTRRTNADAARSRNNAPARSAG